MTETQAIGPGGRVLRLLDRLLGSIEFLTALIAGITIFIVMWIGVTEIFMRKLFNSPLYGQLDLIEQTMALYTLLPISYCWRAAGHIRVDLVIANISGRSRLLFELITTLAAFALITAILPGVVEYFDNAYEIGDSTINTQWPTWPSKSVAIVALAILWVRLLLELFAYLRLMVHPDAEPVAVPKRPSVLEDTDEDPADLASNNSTAGRAQ